MKFRKKKYLKIYSHYKTKNGIRPFLYINFDPSQFRQETAPLFLPQRETTKVVYTNKISRAREYDHFILLTITDASGTVLIINENVKEKRKERGSSLNNVNKV